MLFALLVLGKSRQAPDEREAQGAPGVARPADERAGGPEDSNDPVREAGDRRGGARRSCGRRGPNEDEPQGLDEDSQGIERAGPREVNLGPELGGAGGEAPEGSALDGNEQEQEREQEAVHEDRGG